MADTRIIKQKVEPFVRERLEAELGQPFSQQFLPVGQKANGSEATHGFDAVSADRRIVAGIKSNSGKTSGGRQPTGKIAGAYKELYLLSLVDADRRILVLTDPEFHQIMVSDCDGKLAPGLELMFIELSPELKVQVQAVHGAASQEMTPE